MINGFESITAELDDYEKYTLLPVMSKCLEKRKGKKRAITNKKMCEAMAAYGYDKMHEARVRKIINYIRVMDIVPCLMATAKGYYVTEDKKEMGKYIGSLRDRAAAIIAVASAMERQMSEMDDIKAVS